MRKTLSWQTMVLVLLSSGCAVTIHDYTVCSPSPAGDGAFCNNFYNNNAQRLNAAGWEALQRAWIAKGLAIEVTNSQAIADIKGELEKLCSVTDCNEDQQEKVQKAIGGLNRILSTGSMSLTSVR
jgi:hypothetical protein